MHYVCAVFSAHNWNTLFVGSSAVADTMAQQYGKSKGEILTQVGLLLLSTIKPFLFAMNDSR